MKTVRFAILIAALALTSTILFAHHSFVAVYDANKTVTVSGVVTRVDWLNPHAHFYIDAENEDGAIENWDFELNSPNGLMRLGWTRNSLKIGATITVEGFLARDGSRHVNVRSVTMGDGRELFTGDPIQGGLR